MTISAALLSSLDVMSAESVTMLNELELGREAVAGGDFHEVKRRILELQSKAQELFDWISEMRLESPKQ